MLNAKNDVVQRSSRYGKLLRSVFVVRCCFAILSMAGLAGCDTSLDLVALDLGGSPSTDVPVEVNPESYALIGVSQLEVVSKLGVIANDVTVEAVEPFTGPTEQGGMINLAADGSFFYVAPTQYLGTDYVEYTVFMNGEELTGRAAFKIYPADATPVP